MKWIDMIVRNEEMDHCISLDKVMDRWINVMDQ